ncbi:prolyl oligopeptidase family serine peptidase [Pseudoduganella sp. GCM10020061]|uniref:dipeptidyl-peptidase 5 n=1 Tax=Pseudoduganella sp. GCM10020061 TaxID=3317345 RepID=UPI003624DDEB
MNAPKQKAPCGTWPSPISATVVAQGSVPLSQLACDGADVFWLAGRASEGGRTTLVRRHGAALTELTPAPFNARSRVHEYGGGSYVVADGVAWFTNFADNRVYVKRGADAPVALTRPGTRRFADFAYDARHERLLAVCEDHGGSGYPVNTLVSIARDGSVHTLAEGSDFYSSPRISADGRWVAWLTWELPRMPWEGTELWLAEVQDDGALGSPRRIAGSANESVCQPEWSPQGVLHFVSDRSGWWNLYRLIDDEVQPLCTREAEFAGPHWVFGASMYGFLASGEIICTYIEGGVSRLARLPFPGTLAPVATPYEEIRELRVCGEGVVLLGGAPTIALEVAHIDLDTGARSVLARSIEDLPGEEWLSVPESITFPTAGGASAHAFYYPPRSGDTEPLDKPPLIVIGHGGPTGMASSTLKLATQFWTSRGFAVLDVNYRGSTGFGRAYRDALKGQWGVVDVEDCVAGARYLAQQGRVDPDRLIIRGSSAGGYTVLSALAFHDVFKAGAVYYGVSDLAGLDADSHKFESRYNEYLIAPQPRAQELYRERSPIHHTARISSPTIFFQGLDDKVVPPQQSETMVAALRANSVPVAYLTLEGEGHGFRKADSIVATLEAELDFYLRIFGLASGPPPYRIDNLE